ncbi:unnamed protein product [Cylicocyclus nassatus]|uniref:Uncharacterized protein n=1 Tax=Cylicocyclus nassatus TaxID=53992 RepID=A0AA36M769_CYLNA|nr:unnamed protein product [Cylicocyclus nassatus]
MLRKAVLIKIGLDEDQELHRSDDSSSISRDIREQFMCWTEYAMKRGPHTQDGPGSEYESENRSWKTRRTMKIVVRDSSTEELMDLCKAAKDGEELGKRRDLRDEIIFTIDPKTARLDVTLCNSIGFPINGTSSQQLSSTVSPFRSNSQLMRSINQAEHCNDKKLIAKKVSESSAELFFVVLIHRVGPTEAKGVVVNVLDAAFDVLLFKYGRSKEVLDMLSLIRLPETPHLFMTSVNRIQYGSKLYL